MKGNLPQEYKSNIFFKFIHKIKKIFYRERTKKDFLQVDDSNKVQESNIQNDFFEQIKINEYVKDIEYEKRKFLRELTNNPDLLNNFSNDRLEIILQCYINENNKKRDMLKKISA